MRNPYLLNFPIIVCENKSNIIYNNWLCLVLLVVLSKCSCLLDISPDCQLRGMKRFLPTMKGYMENPSSMIWLGSAVPLFHGWVHTPGGGGSLDLKNVFLHVDFPSD